MSTKTADATPAVVTDATPALIDLSDDPWAGVSDGDLSPATARSIPMLTLNRKEGNGFTDAETGEARITALDFVWLAKSTSRAWWPEAFGKGEKNPTCRSADGVVPDPQSPEVQSQACATCPQAKWESDDKDFRRCVDTIEMLVFLPDPHGFGRLARVRFGGLAYRPTQAYWDSFSARLPHRPPIAFVSHVELEAVGTDNGVFLVPKFSRVRELSIDEARPLIEERDRRIAEWTATVAEDVATGATREAEATGDGFTGTEPHVPPAPYQDGDFDGTDGEAF